MRGANQIEYQNNGCNNSALVGRLIKGNLGTKVYMTSVSGGFDTHENQPWCTNVVMSNLSIAVDNFYEWLGLTQQGKKVLSIDFIPNW